MRVTASCAIPTDELTWQPWCGGGTEMHIQMAKKDEKRLLLGTNNAWNNQAPQ